LTFLKYMI